VIITPTAANGPELPAGVEELEDDARVIRQATHDREIELDPLRDAQVREIRIVTLQIRDALGDRRRITEASTQRIQRQAFHQREERISRLATHTEGAQFLDRHLPRLALDLVDDAKDSGELLVTDAQSLQQGAKQSAIADARANVVGRQTKFAHDV